MTKNKSNLQDIDLSLFEKLNSKMNFPSWLKITGGFFALLIVLSLLSLYFLNFAPKSDKVVKEGLTPTPTIVKEKDISNNRKKWQTIKRQLDDLDPSQKDLLPPEIHLEIEFEQ